LDLSKLHRDSEDGGEGHPEGDESCASLNEMIEGEDGKNVTYKQYLKFLENNNENRLNDPNQLGEESQESLIR